MLPSNEGRGYVLRKIMRRAMRNARMSGVSDPYLYQLTGFVAELMSDAYPEMLESIQRVARVVKDEEHRYATTFQVAEKFFQRRRLSEPRVRRVCSRRGVAFKLYDTYGLALDEQEEMAREAGLTIDREGFAAEMEKQRTRARASWKGAEKAAINPVYQALPRVEFVGRETLETPAEVVAVLDGEIALDRTPFYAEAGGQVGDTGVLISPATGETVAVVETTYAPAPGKNVSKVKMVGPVKPGDAVIARVDTSARRSTMRNHTGTHLLHAALRTVLGTHVKQAGSVVEPSRLRFDFTHYTAMDSDELAEVERLMNEEILKNVEVHTDVMDLDRALEPARWRCSAKNTATKCAWCRSKSSARNCAEARTSPAPAISASARSSMKARFPRACGASRRSPAKARCGGSRKPRALARRKHSRARTL